MTQDPITLYKLIVLYMLDRIDIPLTRAQISDFILEKGYTDFLTMQQVFFELDEAGLVTSRVKRNRTELNITYEGRQTLNFFENRIHEDIRSEIENYLKEHNIALRNETSVSGYYYKSTSGEYEARLTIREKGVSLIDLTLSVPTEQIASSICDNWNKKHDALYQNIVRELF